MNIKNNRSKNIWIKGNMNIKSHTLLGNTGWRDERQRGIHLEMLRAYITKLVLVGSWAFLGKREVYF